MDTAFLIVVCLLGHPDFSVRERASAYLRESGPAAHPYLVVASKAPDLEVARRSKEILETRRLSAIRVLVEANRPLPWIDALGPETEGRCEIISGYLAAARLWRTHTTWQVHDWPEWRDAMELYLFSLSEAEARQVLKKTPRNQYWGGSAWVTPK